MSKQMRSYRASLHYIIQYLTLYFTALFLFAIFRVMLLLTGMHHLKSDVQATDILTAFIMGARFDTVIICYILILPFLCVSLFSFFQWRLIFMEKLSRIYIITLFSLAFFVSAADIPYFNQFFSRFSVSAFEWTNSPVFVVKLIAQQPRYWLYLIPFGFVVFVFARISRRVLRTETHSENIIPNIRIISGVLFLLMMLVGIRGRLERKSPIRTGTAYFSNNAFLNQLGLNPNFTLITSIIESSSETDKKITLMKDADAMAHVQKYLQIETQDAASPFSRKNPIDSVLAPGANVVMIIMEGLSAARMKRHGSHNIMTPFLDSISNESYYFENTYTAGIHTYNGIYSTLFSFPALFRQQPMNGSHMKKYHGAFNELKKHGYTTAYFTTHDGQFDNVEGFLRANGCDTIISESDYPAEEIKTILGVPDHYMFDFSVPVLNKLSERGKPFFAAYMTASNHGPFYIPEWFKTRNTDASDQIVEYADYAMKRFIAQCAREEWFRNTLFVFIADHGARTLDEVYSLSVNYNHAPLIFFAPHLFSGRFFSDMAGQIDVMPTLMGMLGIRYVNNTPGIDLLKEKRPYIFFNADDKYAVIDQEWVLIAGKDQRKWLHKYRNKDPHNYVNEAPEIVQKMDLYARSFLQASQFTLLNNKQ